MKIYRAPKPEDGGTPPPPPTPTPNTPAIVSDGLAAQLAAERAARAAAEEERDALKIELQTLQKQIRIAKTLSQTVGDSLASAARVLELPL